MKAEFREFFVEKKAGFICAPGGMLGGSGLGYWKGNEVAGDWLAGSELGYWKGNEVVGDWLAGSGLGYWKGIEDVGEWLVLWLMV